MSTLVLIVLQDLAAACQTLKLTAQLVSTALVKHLRLVQTILPLLVLMLSSVVCVSQALFAQMV